MNTSRSRNLVAKPLAITPSIAKPSLAKRPRAAPHRWVSACVEETRQLIVKPRSWREWIEIALDALGLVPSCLVVAEAARFGVALLQRDFKTLSGSLLRALPLQRWPLGRLGLLVLKIVDKVRKLLAVAQFSSRVAVRAQATTHTFALS